MRVKGILSLRPMKPLQPLLHNFPPLLAREFPHFPKSLNTPFHSSPLTLLPPTHLNLPLPSLNPTPSLT